MPDVSGSVLYNVTNTSPSTGNAISNVPVVLWNAANGSGLAVLTASDGTFTFNNVGNGSYRLVEAWGTTITSQTSPANFNNAVAAPAPTPQDPPSGSVPNPPATANAVQSLSPNTRTITMSGSNITGQVFIDGPVANRALPAGNISPYGSNLLTSAASGTWGTLPAGSAANSSPANAPYPGVVPDFGYLQAGPSAPSDGNYSVINTCTLGIYSGSWFNTSDHTSRDETGRYAIVNGANPGSLIFSETVSVTSNSYLLVNLWAMNLLIGTGGLPQFGVKLMSTAGVTISNFVLTNLSGTTIPTWVEQGTSLFTGSNTSLIFQIYSNGPAGGGNDYAIDDISVRNAIVTTIANVSKAVDKNIAGVNNNLRYTTVLRNPSSTGVTISNIRFSDTIPSGTTFVPGSVVINGTTFSALNPTPPGFTVSTPSILGPGSTMTISFNVTVGNAPSPNPVLNSSSTSYDFVAVSGGANVTQTLLSNNTSTTIYYADFVNTTKFVDRRYATCGNTITYIITLPNSGNVTATNISFVDTIPNGTTFVSDSLIVNGTLTPGTSMPSSISLPNIAPGRNATISYRLNINC